MQFINILHPDFDVAGALHSDCTLKIWNTVCRTRARSLLSVVNLIAIACELLTRPPVASVEKALASVSVSAF